MVNLKTEKPQSKKEESRLGRPENTPSNAKTRKMLQEFQRSVVSQPNPDDENYVPRGLMDAVTLSLMNKDYQLAIAGGRIIKPPAQGIAKKDYVKSNEGTLSDPRMGATEEELCQTCYLGIESCVGHMGFIPFPYPIFHPALLKPISMLLTVICPHCYNINISNDMISKHMIESKPYFKRLKFIYEQVASKKTCIHCNKTTNNVIVKNDQIMYIQNNKTECCFDPKKALLILESVTETNSKLLGFRTNDVEDFRSSKSSSVIVQGMLVLPPIVRPKIVIDDREEDNPYTAHYKSVLETCSTLISLIGQKKTIDNPDFIATLNALSEKFNMFIGGKSKYMRKGTREANITKLVQGKNGWFRGVMQGKGVNYTARSVASPDPYIRFDQVSLPEEWSRQLTTEEIVSLFNRKSLQYDLLMGKIPSIVKMGETSMRLITQKMLDEDTPEYVHIRTLQVGDKVNRYLRDGDNVIINRQPTLHKNSMLALEAVFKPQKTVGIGQIICTPLNCDFDGK